MWEEDLGQRGQAQCWTCWVWGDCEPHKLVVHMSPTLEERGSLDTELRLMITDALMMKEISENKGAPEQEHIWSINTEETNKAFPERREGNQENRFIQKLQSAANYTKSQIVRTVICPLNITTRSLLMILMCTSASGMLIWGLQQNLNSFKYISKNFFFLSEEVRESYLPLDSPPKIPSLDWQNSSKFPLSPTESSLRQAWGRTRSEQSSTQGFNVLQNTATPPSILLECRKHIFSFQRNRGKTSFPVLS